MPENCIATFLPVLPSAIINIIILILIVYFRNYLSKKGELLATKEDIGKITKEIESIKGEIGARLFIHQTRYQNEYIMLKEITEKLVKVRDAAMLLRPSLDIINKTKPEEIIKSERLLAFYDALKDLNNTKEFLMPFYPEEIYHSLNKFDKASYKESVQYKHGDQNDKNYWEEQNKNCIEIYLIAKDTLDLIRKRVQYWENFNHLETCQKTNTSETNCNQ